MSRVQLLTVGRPVIGSVSGGQLPEVAVTLTAGVIVIANCAPAVCVSSTPNSSLPSVPVSVIWPLIKLDPGAASAPGG